MVRWVIAEFFGHITQAWTAGGRRVIVSMLPRGVAVAVMSFIPNGAGIPNTESFPLCAPIVVALSILFMTAAFALERRRSPEVISPFLASKLSRS